MHEAKKPVNINWLGGGLMIGGVVLFSWVVFGIVLRESQTSKPIANNSPPLSASSPLNSYVGDKAMIIAGLKEATELKLIHSLSDEYAMIAAGLRESNAPDFIRSLSEKALAGDTEAQLILGCRYAKGLGTIKDEEEAAKWFKLASDSMYSRLNQRAEAGDLVAMLELYHRQFHGVCIPVNKASACRWILKAADRTPPGQISQLAKRLESDVRQEAALSPESAEAMDKLLIMAAMKGGAEERFALASRLAAGNERPADQIEAYAWYNLAAANGHSLAAERRAQLESRSDFLNQISMKGQKRSRELLKQIEEAKTSK